MPTAQSEDMLEALKKVSATLRDAGVDHALGGGLALWAVGSPATDHDIDLLVADEPSAAMALEALEAAGCPTDHPPEGWLVKAWQDDVLVDLVFRPTGIDAAEAVAKAPVRNVHAMPMKVMRAEDVFVSKLHACTEHSLRFEPLLEHARALREQIDWREVAARSAGSPYARAFLALLDGLGIVDAAHVKEGTELAEAAS